MTSGILVPQPGIKPVCPALKGGFSTTGESGNLLSIIGIPRLVEALPWSCHHMSFSLCSAALCSNVLFLHGLSHIGLVPILMTSAWDRPQLQSFRNTPVCRCVWPRPLNARGGDWSQYPGPRRGIKGNSGFLFLPFQSSCSLSLHPMPSGSLSLLRSPWKEVVKPSQPVAPALRSNPAWSLQCDLEPAISHWVSPAGGEGRGGWRCDGIDGASCDIGARAAGQKTPAAITFLACFFFYQRWADQQGEKKKTLPFVNLILWARLCSRDFIYKTSLYFPHVTHCFIVSKVYFLIWTSLHPLESLFPLLDGKSLDWYHPICDVGRTETSFTEAARLSRGNNWSFLLFWGTFQDLPPSKAPVEGGHIYEPCPILTLVCTFLSHLHSCRHAHEPCDLTFGKKPWHEFERLSWGFYVLPISMYHPLLPGEPSEVCLSSELS